MKEIKENFRQLKDRAESILSKIDADISKKKLRELESQSLKSDFWADVLNAQAVMQEIAANQAEVGEIEDLQLQLRNLSELLALPEGEIVSLDFEKELSLLNKQVDRLEKRLFFSGKYDHGGCFLSIHAGQGGVEAMDWVTMLSRMYTRFAEAKGWQVTTVDETKGEEAGLKTVTFEIVGRDVYGLLKKESGTHRLVRLSPFNSDNLRQTSFALVEVLPVVEEETAITIAESDIEFEAFRASGPGGQNVQKVSTAVRLKHKLTGLIVSAQSERSQHQNRENALKILKAKLYQKQEEERLLKEKSLKSWQKTATWGSQIRNYVLHPYKLVKDLRSGFETSDTEAILNGELDSIIEAQLRL